MSGNDALQEFERQPWIDGKLAVDSKVLKQVEAHAVECYPSESCGFLHGPADDWQRVDGITREVNEADKYHKLDPERFPRTSEMYFKINELRASRAFDEGQAAGRPIKVIYHSHCDAGAYFSEEDAATFASDAQLMWPCAFLVVSVVDGVVKDRKLWVHKIGSNDFVEGAWDLL